MSRNRKSLNPEDALFSFLTHENTQQYFRQFYNHSQNGFIRQSIADKGSEEEKKSLKYMDDLKTVIEIFHPEYEDHLRSFIRDPEKKEEFLSFIKENPSLFELLKEHSKIMISSIGILEGSVSRAAESYHKLKSEVESKTNDIDDLFREEEIYDLIKATYLYQGKFAENIELSATDDEKKALEELKVFQKGLKESLNFEMKGRLGSIDYYPLFEGSMVEFSKDSSNSPFYLMITKSDERSVNHQTISRNLANFIFDNQDQLRAIAQDLSGLTQKTISSQEQPSVSKKSPKPNLKIIETSHLAQNQEEIILH